MEEISLGQYRMPIQRHDGVRVNMEIKQKRTHSRKRRVKTWTQEEDAILLDLYSLHPKKWALIASLMQDRNQNQCLHRYRRITQLGDHRKIWTTEEDESIRKLMKKVGKNWKVLSQMLGTKTGKQIRERFINKLDPKIKREDWTDQQDRKIIRLYSEIGRRWSEISKQLSGRPQNKVKNRFYSFIQKNYDIKYRPIQDHTAKEEPRQESEMQQRNSVNCFRQISNFGKANQLVKSQPKEVYHLPSINHFEDELKEPDQENAFNKGLVSMRKVEEEWKDEKKDQFGEHEEFNNQFFFLSNP